jgi:hypothetical protein
MFVPISYQVAMESITGLPAFVPFRGARRRQEAIQNAFHLAGAHLRGAGH